MTDFGRIPPPRSYVDPDAIDYWAREDDYTDPFRHADHLKWWTTPLRAIEAVLDDKEAA